MVRHIGFLIILSFLACADLGYSQSSRCVILEKQGSGAVVSCDGGQTRFIELGGKADLYKAGDSVDAPDIETRSPKQRPDKQK
jgi:hypothetical protein